MEDIAGWTAGLDELTGQIASRFGRVEPRRRARAYLLGLLAPLDGKGPVEVLQVTTLTNGRIKITDTDTGDGLILDGNDIEAQHEDPAMALPADASPIAGCGLDWGRPYCDITPAGQGLLLAGAGGAVAAAVCAAGGTVVCVVSSGLVAAAVWYVIEYGRCSGNLRVRSNYGAGISVFCL